MCDIACVVCGMYYLVDLIIYIRCELIYMFNCILQKSCIFCIWWNECFCLFNRGISIREMANKTNIMQIIEVLLYHIIE